MSLVKKLVFGIIGIGNCGSQQAMLGTKFDIRGLAINTSELDFQSVEGIPAILIGDENGTGRDRDLSKEFFDEHRGRLLKDRKLLKIIDECDVIFVSSSTSGGSGSGIAPLLRAMLSAMFPDTLFVLAGTLPRNEEGYIAHVNTLQYINEISLTDAIYMLYDNNKVKGPVKRALETVNERFINDIRVLRGDFNQSTPLETMDPRDLINSILESQAGGRLVVVSSEDVKTDEIGNITTNDIIVRSMKQLPIPDVNTKFINSLSMIINMSQELHDTIDIDISEFCPVFKTDNIGFRHLGYDEAKTNWFFILAGTQGMPLRKAALVKREEELRISSQLRMEYKEEGIDLSNTLERVSGTKSTKRKQTAKTAVDLDAIFAKFK